MYTGLNQYFVVMEVDRRTISSVRRARTISTSRPAQLVQPHPCLSWHRPRLPQSRLPPPHRAPRQPRRPAPDRQWRVCCGIPHVGGTAGRIERRRRRQLIGDRAPASASGSIHQPLSTPASSAASNSVASNIAAIAASNNESTTAAAISSGTLTGMPSGVQSASVRRREQHFAGSSRPRRSCNSRHRSDGAALRHRPLG